MFASPVYTTGKRPKAGDGEAAYWLPVLSLYYGHRQGELAQLDRADVVKKSGIWCLQVTETDEDLQEDDRPKSVKTADSVRIVPLHSAVIALGFLDYVGTVKGKRLWPKISPMASVDGPGTGPSGSAVTTVVRVSVCRNSTVYATHGNPPLVVQASSRVEEPLPDARADETPLDH